MDAARGVVRVRKEALAACMTCPLCQGILREAVAAALCLHTFCRECIMAKIEDDEIDCCPVCNVYLGYPPEDKLRPDHSIQYIINKVFPPKREKVEVPAVTLPVKRKQRSLSSLAVETPRVATETGLTGRRTKAARRASTSHATALGDNGTMKEPDKSEDRCQKSGKIAAPISVKMAKAAKKKQSTPKQSNTDVVASSQASSEGRKTDKTIEKEDLSKPLISSFLDASGFRSVRTSTKSHATSSKMDKMKSTDGELPISNDASLDKVATTRKREGAHSKLKHQQEYIAASVDKSSACDYLRKRPETGSQQGLLDSTSSASLHDQITAPVWFSLVPSLNQTKDEVLPQLSNNYLRIKDGTLPVSSIQRYIMKKFALASNDEVEIMCHGWPICPSTTLSSLMGIWLSRQPARERMHQTAVGAPAGEFVMVLNYRRRLGARSLCCTSSLPESPCHCSAVQGTGRRKRRRGSS